MQNLLTVDAIACRYDQREVFRDLSFSVAAGSIACLLGPSGCGKTTALRAIAGFEPVVSGSIVLDGNVLSKSGMTLPPEQRQVGMVFQDYALFPHLTVAANIAFGLTQHTKTERQQITTEMLALIRMDEYAHVYPHQLSGGQQQRVALARALAPRPKLLLLDEPFSNLDTELRRSLSIEVRDILRKHGTTAILVTHDQTEAFHVADVIGVMADGKLWQWGTPRELYHEPHSPFVASFVANGQFLQANMLGNNRVTSVFGETVLEEIQTTVQGTSVDLLIRPWNIMQDNAGPCEANIVNQQFNGATTITTVVLADGTRLNSQDPVLAALPENTPVRLTLNPRQIRVFPR
ncbi:MAG: ABC transporter ATP-binding protein [Pseudomonadota bacterium]